MPVSANLSVTPLVKLDGAALAPEIADRINDLRVSQSLGLPSQLTMRVSDPDFAVIDSDKFAIATVITAQFEDKSGTPVSVFAGEIVTVGIDQAADRPDANEVVITALDKSHRLRHTTRVRTFQKQKYSDVVSTIASETGLQADIEATTITFDYLIQTTSNFDFLNELAFRTGYDWWIDDSKLHFRKRVQSAAVEIDYAQDVRRLKTRFTATNEFKSITVTSWDPLSKNKVVGSATPKNERLNGNPLLAVNGRSKAKPFVGDLATSSLVGGSADEVKELAESLAARFDGSGMSARAECIGMPSIRAGSIVAIKNAGTKVSGEYFVATCEHHFSPGRNLATTFTTGGLDRTSIVDMLGGSAATAVPGFGVTGLTIGIVTNNKDPDGTGRVRVKFPALSDAEESWWARVATPGGGSSAGLMMMPQIGDEVLVGFEGGDLRRPFVLGGLWGSKAKPPTPSDTFLAQNKVVEWGLKTANGSALAVRSGTAPADKHFKLQLPDGTLLYLGSDKTEIVAKNKTLELKSGQASVLLTATGDVKIKGANVTIDATQGIKINGLTIDLKANTSFKAEGAAVAELKGGATTTVQASGVAAVKGSIVQIN